MYYFVLYSVYLVEFLRFLSHSVKHAEWELHAAETSGKVVDLGLHPAFPKINYSIVLCIFCSSDVKGVVPLENLGDKIS